MLGSVLYLPVICPMGNCTWPIIPSLRVCGACSNVTSFLVSSCNGSFCDYVLPYGGDDIVPDTYLSMSLGHPWNETRLKNAPRPNTQFGPYYSSTGVNCGNMSQVSHGSGIMFPEARQPFSRNSNGTFQPIALFDFIILALKMVHLRNHTSLHLQQLMSVAYGFAYKCTILALYLESCSKT